MPQDSAIPRSCKQGCKACKVGTFPGPNNCLPCQQEKYRGDLARVLMAETEHGGEDLMRTATAMTPRIEIAVEGFSSLVFVGFRRSSGSLYVGEDPAYHFNGAGEIRRAYYQGRMVKAEAGNLVALISKRHEGSGDLVRDELDAVSTAAFLADAGKVLEALAEALEQGCFRVTRQVPEKEDLIARCRQWLTDLPRPLRVAAVANVHG